jgi:hypothetical protein
MTLLPCPLVEPAGIARYTRRMAVLMIWLNGEQG